MGITGAADTVIVLRRERNSDEGVLHITGRDVGEQAIAISHTNGAWVYKGEALAVAMTETQEEILGVMWAEGRPLKQKEIADLSGRKNQGFTKTLTRMVKNGLVSRDNNHRYTPVETLVKDPPKFAKQETAEEKVD